MVNGLTLLHQADLWPLQSLISSLEMFDCSAAVQHFQQTKTSFTAALGTKPAPDTCAGVSGFLRFFHVISLLFWHPQLWFLVPSMPSGT